ncbi:MoxR family ATPase [Lacrimispora sp. NSJ-141]|uniref:MoxR family ATPase n=1 Tax=Lientehia hominis TaxID=2897778 RepID=A0AAP2RKH8_9FIRM|nr:MoxR family ATPase [Lientehia hominis]MCD2493340.1 MoxR family ATPase [Lientehia hominis]
MYQKAAAIINEVKKAVIGKDVVIGKVLMAVLSGGHILLEDRPGVGKTTMALAFSRAMDLEYKRIQFTPEVMPADVVGFTIYNQAAGRLEYQPGPALCNLFLADEINRTSSKTQSALLEAMEEGKVTVDGVTHEIPKPFTVIATQNPAGSAGTQLLPESQLDRFIVRLSMGYPTLEEEIAILKTKQGRNPLEEVCQAVTGTEILRMQAQAESVYIADEIYLYIARLTGATRSHAMIRTGISPRGTIALAKMSRAAAWISGRDYVVPADVRSVFFDVLEHRLVTGPQARLNNATAHGILGQVLKTVPVPRLI